MSPLFALQLRDMGESGREWTPQYCSRVPAEQIHPNAPECKVELVLGLKKNIRQSKTHFNWWTDSGRCNQLITAELNLRTFITCWPVCEFCECGGICIGRFDVLTFAVWHDYSFNIDASHNGACITPCNLLGIIPTPPASAAVGLIVLPFNVSSLRLHAG